MGLTCRDALGIFSEHETLRLQARVAELEKRLHKYEPTKRVFQHHVQYRAVRDEADAYLKDWIERNVTASTPHAFWFMGFESVCDPFALREAVTHSLCMITQDRIFSESLAGDCVDIAAYALEAALYIDELNHSTWCTTDRYVRQIIQQTLLSGNDGSGGFICHSLIDRGAVDWEKDI